MYSLRNTGSGARAATGRRTSPGRAPRREPRASPLPATTRTPPPDRVFGTGWRSTSPADASELAAGAGSGPGFPGGALQTRTDFGRPGYGGPCPPEGDHPHRYLFTVHAVGVESLPVDADTSAAVVGFMLHFNTLEKASLMGLYKR